MTRPILLDLFCGAGGAAMGYHRAGFDVVGVDIAPQPHYPFEFHLADALTFPLDGFDAIHASPPCQHYSIMNNLPWLRLRETWDSIPPTRERLTAATVPWIIENVDGAPLDRFFLCGAMFGLRFEDGTPIYRHRLFETSPDFFLLAPGHPKHTAKVTSPERNAKGNVSSGLRRRVLSSAGIREISRQGVPGKASKATLARFGGALGIDWMSGPEVGQAIPPAYTEWIGAQLLRAIGAAA
jgi:DNA (cytosine-5)-methyltransferase 1